MKVFVVGLDGATLDLIAPWAKKGKLPNLSKLMEEGCHGVLETVIPPLSGPAWVSFMTGKNPGAHCIFDFMYRSKGSYDVSYIDGQHQRKFSKNLWQILSEYSKKVAVVNVMVTWPPHEVNGIMITGGLTPPDREFTYPLELKNELEKEIGGYLISPIGGYTVGEGDTERLVEKLHEMEENRIAATLYLMKRYEWDFFMVLFGGTDVIQHETWKYMDPEHPGYTRESNIKFGSEILKMYQKMDTAIGQILDISDDDTYFIIVSDHGFGPLHTQMYINTWLVEKGFLCFKETLAVKVKRWMFSNSINLWKLYPIVLRLGFDRIKNLFWGGRGEKALDTMFLSQKDIDWSKTIAYSRGTLGQIFINLEGREPRGIVKKEEYEQVRDNIIEELKKLRAPKNGADPFERIYKKEEIYSGKYLDDMPDIVFIPKRGYAAIERFQFLSNNVFEDSRASGQHQMDGVFFIKGPDINAGKSLTKSKIYDVAPTILHILGLPVPEDMDGKVLKEIFRGDGELGKSVVYRKSPEKNPVSENVAEKALSSEDEAKIRERLRGLGYLG